MENAIRTNSVSLLLQSLLLSAISYKGAKWMNQGQILVNPNDIQSKNNIVIRTSH